MLPSSREAMMRPLFHTRVNFVWRRLQEEKIDEELSI
jgi:hypothetical protein